MRRSWVRFPLWAPLCRRDDPTIPTTTERGDRDTTGANDISTRPSISDDGRVVAYNSDMCNLVPEQPQMAGLRGTIVRWMR
jgi:hypothetical protein